MSLGYVAIQWNASKRVYDAALAASVVGYLGVFVACGKLLRPDPRAISDEVLAIRALGTCAFLMLHVALCIGPLARLDRRFLPLLYNRRHLGVATFIVALLHGVIATGYYHGFGNVNPLVSLLGSNTNFFSLAAFPFQILGFIALLILFVMAATSHDFWLRNLGSRTWKRLHMLVYPAYLLLVGHVSLGILQSQRGGVELAVVLAGFALVTTLHIVAALRETRRDRGVLAPSCAADTALWRDVGPAGDLAENRGSTVTIDGGERIAIFRHNGCVSATANVCAHQGGPLGEGRIIDGCITCPWHGWQYRPADGQSPPPFAEKIATYRVQVRRGRILIDPTPLPPGTPVPPAPIDEAGHA